MSCRRLLLGLSLALAASVGLGTGAVAADGARALTSFETQADLAVVDVRSATGARSEEHATEGLHSLRVGAEDYLVFVRLPRDWSGFDALEADIYVDLPDPVSLYVLIGDEAWEGKSTYWNRHNASYSLRPKANTLSIPLGGLYRGEVGSRQNDLKSNIDPGSIVRLDLGFTPTGGKDGFIYLDNLRLTRWGTPGQVRAFDFGPSGQSLAPGFASVSRDDTYSEERGWGWEAGSQPGRAWDVAFPSRLLQDSIAVGEAAFRVKLRPGNYHVAAFFEPLGYWSGEQAQYEQREIFGPNWRVREEHGEWGRLDHIYQFENTEPMPGDDLWDIYMSYLFRPMTAEVEVGEEGIFELRVSSDGENARRLAGLIIYPKQDQEAAKWAVDVLFQQRDEFESRAVELSLPETENAAPITAEDKARGYQLFTPSVEETVYFSTLPVVDQRRASLETSAARGEARSLTVAIRPLRDLGPVELGMSELTGEAGVIPAECITVSVVRHLPSRSLESLMYRFTPRYLVPASEVALPADLTRQLWLTVRVPDDAAAGEYQGLLTLLPAEDKAIEVPIRVTVLPFSLHEPDFLIGFFGIRPDVPLEGEEYDALQREVFAMFLDRGFNSFTGGPAIEFKGLDEQGEPIIDFAEADKFLAAARAAGYRKEFNNYGGFVLTGLYDIYSYTKGETGAAVEQEYGLPFEEIARRVWAAVEAHAREQNWLPFSYHMCDETRTVEAAREQLKLMRLFNEVSPWLKTGGSYSVSFEETEDPLELALQDFFRVLDVSMLNNHDELIMAKARELGKQVQIYNQGRDRYTFGAYLWSERAKGVSALYQWIAFVRHGYEYFDLDGREPDPGAILFASDGLRPSLMLERCAEGINDLRYLQTLEDLAKQAARSGSGEAEKAAAEAQAFLAGIADRIQVNERSKPAGLDLEATRAEAARRILELQRLGCS